MTPLPSQLLSVQNESTVVDQETFYNAAWALAYQLSYHYGRSPWVTAGIAPPAKVIMLAKDVKPPPGAWNLILMDHSDEEGTLGFHTDAEGTNIPYSDVFCKDAIEDGSAPSSVLSHEGLEMLVDPHVEKPYVIKRGSKLYIVEIADAVQGNDYDVGAPENREVGVKVSDFCYPWWWGVEKDLSAKLSFRDSVTAPFQLAKEGYISVAEVATPEKWEPVFGEKITSLPKWASRLPKIHAQGSGVVLGESLV